MKTQLSTLLVLLILISSPSGAGLLLYVDDDASGPVHDGKSWHTAFTNLQDALAALQADGHIRVAQGTYRPDQGDGMNPGDRTATFTLKKTSEIEGGYAGVNAQDPNERMINVYETILSGDLMGNDLNVADPCDLLSEPTRQDNSYNVVTVQQAEFDTLLVLDGFTITGGHAHHKSSSREGGGLYNYKGSPVVENCRFIGNSAYQGGAISNDEGFIVVAYSSFIHNSAGNSGGAVSSLLSMTNLTHCRFIGNEVVTKGMGNGGALFNRNSNVTITNCSFSGNQSSWYGGGIYNLKSDAVISNCSFINNHAVGDGSGLSNTTQSTVFLTNCIVWDAGAKPIFVEDSLTNIHYSNTRSLWPGEGNISQDPCFVDADGADNLIGTEDDDLHLLSGSPCIDAGDNSAVSIGNEFDLDDLERFIDDPCTVDSGKGEAPIVDMGAFEWRPPAQAAPETIIDTYPAEAGGAWGIGGSTPGMEGAEMAFQFEVKDIDHELYRITVQGFSWFGGNVVLHLYADQSDMPGSKIASWGPESFTSDRWPGADLEVDIPSGPILKADTKYWLSLTADPVTGEHNWMQSTQMVTSRGALRYRDNPSWIVFSLPGVGDAKIGTMHILGIPQYD